MSWLIHHHWIIRGKAWAGEVLIRKFGSHFPCHISCTCVFLCVSSCVAWRSCGFGRVQWEGRCDAEEGGWIYRQRLPLHASLHTRPRPQHGAPCCLFELLCGCVAGLQPFCFQTWFLGMTSIFPDIMLLLLVWVHVAKLNHVQTSRLRTQLTLSFLTAPVE